MIVVPVMTHNQIAMSPALLMAEWSLVLPVFVCQDQVLKVVDSYFIVDNYF